MCRSSWEILMQDSAKVSLRIWRRSKVRQWQALKPELTHSSYYGCAMEERQKAQWWCLHTRQCWLDPTRDTDGTGGGVYTG